MTNLTNSCDSSPAGQPHPFIRTTMGSGRDKRKKAKGSKKPGAGAEKTAKKTEKNLDKASRRLEKKAQASCTRGKSHRSWMDMSCTMNACGGQCMAAKMQRLHWSASKQ